MLSYWWTSATTHLPDEHAVNKHDWIEEIYAPFDSLSTDIDDYIWPTDASTKLSSGFAEFRQTHFHAGIDIGTNARRGYKVYAARDGYISRIYVSPFGYGKMLHVTHRDGFSTTYAHLQRFNNSIESFAKELQQANGFYALDVAVEPGRFVVQKGEVIAYTGDTGVGLPHLHFEIRDRGNNPINPLRLSVIFRTIEDTIGPDLQRIGFIPLDHTSSVRNDFRPWSTNLRSITRSSYSTSSPTHIDGSIGIVIKGTDRINSAWHRNGIYRLEMYLNDSLLFRSQLDQLLHTEGRQVALYYDWSSVLQGKRRYQKLFIERGNRLPIYRRSQEGTGIIETRRYPEGIYELRIVASDIKGNRTEISAPLLIAKSPNIDAKIDGDNFLLKSEAPQSIQSVLVGSRTSGGSRWITQTLGVVLLQKGEEGFILPLKKMNNTDVKVTVVDKHGLMSQPKFINSSPSKEQKQPLRLEKEFYRDYLYIRLTSPSPFSLQPAVWLTSGAVKNHIELRAQDDHSYTGTFPLSNLQNEAVRLEVYTAADQREKRLTEEFHIYQIDADRGGSVCLDDGSFSISFPPGSLYAPLYCRVERNDERYSVFPKDILLKSPVTVRLRIPPHIPRAQLGLFFEDDGDFRLLSKLDSSDNDFIEGTVSRLLGDFWIMRDSIPPSITTISLTAKKNQVQLSFRILDEISGIHPDKILLTLNDQLLIPQYDPYGKRITYSGNHQLSGKTNQVKLSVEDRIGNISTITRTL